jgi:glycosyltransferase involved in cell wall biosynthesis
MTASPNAIGVAVIAKNEADRIRRLLESVAFAAEVVVVLDADSADATGDICRRHGARVERRKWSGYAEQKQYALSLVGSPWVLNLDADEEVPEALAAEMTAAVARAPEETAGFSMPRLSRYLGRWIRHGGWYPDRKVRLVRAGAARWEGDGLHERLTADGAVQALSQPLLHHVYRNIADQVDTMNRYSTLTARHLPARGGWFVAAGLFHALGKLAECYLWKAGFRDGWPGMVIAVNSAAYVFLKHAKRWEAGLGRRQALS